MKKKWISLFIIISLALAVSACSSGTNKAEEAKTDSAAEKPSSESVSVSSAAELSSSVSEPASSVSEGTSSASEASTSAEDETADVSEAVSSSENGSSRMYSFDLKEAGVSFDLPKELQDMRGSFQSHYGSKIDEDSGVCLSALTYCAMDREKYDELVGKSGSLTDEDIDFVASRMVDCIFVFTIDGSRSLEDLAVILNSYGIPSEGCKELGSAGEYRFYYLVDPFADSLDSFFVFDDGFREEYDAVLRACEKPSWIRFYEPEGFQTAQAGDAVIFETADLAGNAVRSEEVFSANRLTMVNLWGTYCGPCIGEMPDLEELNGRLQEKDCGIIGIVCDIGGVNDSKMIQTAEEIIADTGVTYRNLIPWPGFAAVFPAQFIPTTYFVDTNGTIVGEPAVGARGVDEYEALIDELLAAME